MLTFITGGARSGKSSFAVNKALKLSENPVYIATARVWDKEFEQRVNRHKEERGPEWTTYEAWKDLSSLPLQGRTVVIDCVTLWLTNFFVEYKEDVDRCLDVFKKEIDELLKIEAEFLLISNEIGMGVHAHSESGRKFTDLQGWANQYAASKAENVIFMVSGLPMTLKGNSK
ncbi:MAG: bifunctional adenosylcobinamide kinase/adenosylcobinamide-phosphate guanylyltransferase [Balneolaceae bacterium]